MKSLLGVLTSIVFIALVLSSASAGLALHGEATDQLTADDIRDVESLAAEIIPGRRLASIECIVSKDGGRTVSLLHVYAEPHEQTSRLWHGLFFKCQLENRYRPPTLGERASHQDRLLNLTTHKRG